MTLSAFNVTSTGQFTNSVNNNDQSFTSDAQNSSSTGVAISTSIKASGRAGSQVGDSEAVYGALAAAGNSATSAGTNALSSPDKEAATLDADKKAYALDYDKEAATLDDDKEANALDHDKESAKLDDDKEANELDHDKESAKLDDDKEANALDHDKESAKLDNDKEAAELDKDR
ncbi:MAG: hypothetical protein VW934_12390, partial [Alphaproteobacteria bacterium]